jgi:hypothetical protein
MVMALQIVNLQQACTSCPSIKAGKKEKWLKDAPIERSKPDRICF